MEGSWKVVLTGSPKYRANERLNPFPAIERCDQPLTPTFPFCQNAFHQTVLTASVVELSSGLAVFTPITPSRRLLTELPQPEAHDLNLAAWSVSLYDCTSALQPGLRADMTPLPCFSAGPGDETIAKDLHLLAVLFGTR